MPMSTAMLVRRQRELKENRSATVPPRSTEQAVENGEHHTADTVGATVRANMNQLHVVSTTELVRMAEHSIALEVLAYFHDMNVCKELERWGCTRVERALHGGDTRARDENGTACKEALSSKEDVKGASRRPRLSMAQRLLADLLSDKAAACEEVDPLSPTGPPHRNEGDTRPFVVTARDCKTRILTTLPCTVLSGYFVMWAETMLEAEVAQRMPMKSTSSTELKAGEMEPVTNNNISQTHLETLQVILKALPSNVGRQVSSREATGAAADVTTPSTPSSPTTNAAGTDTAPRSRTKRPQQAHASREDKENARMPCAGVLKGDFTSMTSFCNSTSAEPTSGGRNVRLRFHSVHIVHHSALHNPRAASFALQSIFQVPLAESGFSTPSSASPLRSKAQRGRSSRVNDVGELAQKKRFLAATSLECYPRHVIHFALPAYALWNRNEVKTASPSTVRHALSRKQTRPFGKGKLAHARSSASGATAAPPAVLILGLGGNVLGQCLDAILPPHIDLDVVELEPAVVEACVRHGQTPPLSTLQPSLKEDISVSALPKRARGKHQTEASSVQEGSSLLGSRCVFAFPRAANREAELRTARYEGPVGHYTFHVQDAAAFLDASAPQHHSDDEHKSIPLSRKRQPQPEEHGFASPHHPYYDIIVLDCYDPEREAMMFGGGLVDRCRRRLRPSSGCLVVNAHVVPRKETLVEDFLKHGFAAVQAVRVAGCDQSVIACFMGDEQGLPTGRRKPEPAVMPDVAQRCARFTKHDLQTTCEDMNAGCVSCSAGTLFASAGEAGNVPISDFLFDASWMKSCRPFSLSPTTPPHHHRRRSVSSCSSASVPRSKCSRTEKGSADAGGPERCCCVWEHKV